MIMMPAK